MTHTLNRRSFLATSAALGMGMAATRELNAADFKTQLHKSLICAPTEALLQKYHDAGFEGVESNQRQATVAEASQARKVAERLEMKIHSVLAGWQKFNDPQKSEVDKDIHSMEVALKAAQSYGASAVLIVPCRIQGMAIPKAHEFNIKFDESTGHIRQVVSGDNRQYEAYVEAHNHATDTSREAIKQLIPMAEKTGVIIAVENVWNNLWVKPALMKNFVQSFDSPWVQVYYDIGNHVKYARPEEWIRVLNKLIVKIHVKDFHVDRKANRGGSFVDIRDGDVNWPAVRRELDAIGYNGWMTIEGSGKLSLEERNERLELILAGK